MKTTKLFTALSLMLAAAIAQAAPDAPPTRAQVHAETAAAVRDGDVPSGYDVHTMRELLPSMYAHDAARRARAAGQPASAQAVAASAARGRGE